MEQLYEDLVALTEDEAFYFADQEFQGQYFRIFNYRMASYTEFLKPGALDCRGIMFQIDEYGHYVRLASRPMQKFFNLNENPMTMDIDLWDVETVMDKADGSLISSFTVNDVVHLKSRGSLVSEQAQAATNLLNSAEHSDLLFAVQTLEVQGFTVNMEYCAPDNRIVIGYEKPQLIVLNARRRYIGDYLSVADCQKFFGEYFVHVYNFGDNNNINVRDSMVGFLNNLPDATGIEGVVLIMSDGLWIKMKTEAYMTAHRAKDSINSPRRLFEAVLEEATDDLRSLFYDDPLALKLIEEMEQRVEGIYNHTVDTVEAFFKANGHLDRKEYAILGQKELVRRHFGLAMSKWLGREVDYKAFLRKNYKDFGIKDDPEPTGDE